VVIGIGYLVVDKLIFSKRPAASVQSFVPGGQSSSVYAPHCVHLICGVLTMRFDKTWLTAV
jgi:hypothetical protein